MKRLLLGLFVVALIGGAIAWSESKDGPKLDFDFKSEKRNPVTHLKLNNDPAEFRFAIVSDRTGGHRPKVFAKAVEQLNLLQPEFVLSVGDLIEGYTTSKTEMDRQWREFQTYVSRLQMPFFYVPGNHDISNKEMLEKWKEKFGRRYYEFIYRDTLFLCLDSEDPPGKGAGSFSTDQINWVKTTLTAHKGVRWVLLFLHKPVWMLPGFEKTGWLEIEQALAGRRYTVFAGHVHNYRKFVRQGNNYYSLATTGGDSRLRGPEYGEFDHLTWVTMKKDGGPVIANLALDGILREDLNPIHTEEEGVKELYRRPTYPTTGRIHYKGRPLVGAYVVLHGQEKTRAPRADGLSEADGSIRFSTYTAFDGAPVGDYTVTVEQRNPLFLPEGKRGPDALGGRYAVKDRSPFVFKVTSGGPNVLELNLTGNEVPKDKEDKK